MGNDYKKLNKQDIEHCLQELAVRYKQNGGTKKIEMILVGGAALVLQYDFRENTGDIDATFQKDSCLQKSMNEVAEKNGLDGHWLNRAIEKLDPSVPRLMQYANLYAAYEDILYVYTVDTDHLLALKLIAGRNSIMEKSDILHLMQYEKEHGRPYTYARVDKAVKDLYDNWNLCNDIYQDIVKRALVCDDLAGLLPQLEKEQTEREKNAMRQLMIHMPELHSYDEFVAYTVELGFHLKAQHAETLYEKLQCFSGKISDEELENISGGGCPPDKEKDSWEMTSSEKYLVSGVDY